MKKLLLEIEGQNQLIDLDKTRVRLYIDDNEIDLANFIDESLEDGEEWIELN